MNLPSVGVWSSALRYGDKSESAEALGGDPGDFPREQWRRIAAALH